MGKVLEATADEKIEAAFSAPTEGRSLGDLAVAGSKGAVVERIVTAQPVAVPRDDGRILQKLRALAAAAGEDWYYRFPVKDHGSTKHIEGPTIKCANNVARLYGNCEIDTRALDNGDSWIIYARLIDWETGFSMTRPFEQMKGQQTIKTADQGRQRQNAFQIGVSKSIRNVITNALEQFTTFAWTEAKKNLVEKVGKKLPEYRDRVLAALKELRVDVHRVEATRGRPAKDWLADDVAMIIAEMQAVKDGMATVDETWPPDAPARPTRADFKEGAGAPKQDGPAKPQEPKPEAAEGEGEPAKLELAIVDLDGEEHVFEKVTTAIDAMFPLLEEAEARGPKDVAGLEETNAGLFKQLREAGYEDAATGLERAFAKAATNAAAKQAPKKSGQDSLFRK